MNTRLSCDKATALYRMGDLEEAERLYLQIIEQEPGHFDACYKLGLIRFKQGRNTEALTFLASALRTKSDPDALTSYGLVLHAAKRFDEALESFDKALTLSPDMVDALNNRGNTLQELKRFDEALASFDKALALSPQSAAVLNNRGNALRNANKFVEALASFEKALAITPHSPMILNNQGNALRNLKRRDEALASFDKALAIRPDNALILYNRGNILTELGRFAEALATFDRTLALNPNIAEVLNARGNVLIRLGRPDEALASFDKALTLNSNYAEAAYGRGNAFCDMKRFEDALQNYDKAVAINPRYSEAWNNRGNTLWNLRRYDEALNSLNNGLAIDPNFVEALYNRGIALQTIGRFADALASYDEAAVIKPDYADAINNCGNILMELHRFDEARVSFEKVSALEPSHRYAVGNLATAVINLCDWNRAAILTSEIGRVIADNSRIIPPLTFLGFSADPALQFACARNFIQDAVPARPQALCEATPKSRHDRIRVAYLSADFHEHATASLLAGLIECHDRSRFEIVGISYGTDDGSEIRSRLVRAFDRFCDVRLKNDLEAAQFLQALEVDIAVDLKGHTRGARPGILSHRPCPIQVNYLGYPGTMNADFIDYIIADGTIMPPHLYPFFAEKIALLPDCYQANDSKRSRPAATSTRKEAGLPEQGFVFCSFNNSWKITAPMFDIWMRLLGAVPNSVLWLLDDNAGASRNLRKEAAIRGIDPQRLVFAPRVSRDQHLARHHLADLFLDTSPYNAHTTASEALWMGLPLVTCLGATFAGRVAASLLHAIGLPELIASDIDAYEALALKLAHDRTLLQSLQVKLAENRSRMPLFDTDRFRRHIEGAYLTMWERWQRGEPTQNFRVSAAAARNDLAPNIR